MTSFAKRKQKAPAKKNKIKKKGKKPFFTVNEDIKNNKANPTTSKNGKIAEKKYAEYIPASNDTVQKNKLRFNS